jgi:hypothetical protein
MDSNEYKIRTNDPCAFRKEVLDESLEVLKKFKAKEASVIEDDLKIGGIPKPEKHHQPIDYDFFWVKCTSEEADNITGFLFDAEAAAVPESGDTTPEASRLAGLVDIWTNFRDWLDQGGSVEAPWEKDH